MAPPRSCPKKRLLDRVLKDERGCWIWQGPVGTDGYGHITIGRKTYRAHRVAFDQLVGPIPHGLWVLHKCDRPLCVNPDHLFLGNARDNAIDREAKGRGWIATFNKNRTARRLNAAV